MGLLSSPPKHIARRELTLSGLFVKIYIMHILLQTKLGPVTIDEADISRCSGYSWRLDNRGYVRAQIIGTNPPREIYLHRLLLDCPTGYVTDHIDHNPRNNCRSNIRICSQAENMRNKRGRRGASGFIGVWKDTRQVSCDAYRAYVTVGKKQQHIGVYSTAEEAARARDEKAKELHGEFAILNFKETK